MKPRQLIDRVREWLRGSRRRRIGAIGVGLVVIAAGIAVPLYFAVFAGAGEGPAVSPTPVACLCTRRGRPGSGTGG